MFLIAGAGSQKGPQRQHILIVYRVCSSAVVILHSRYAVLFFAHPVCGYLAFLPACTVCQLMPWAATLSMFFLFIFLILCFIQIIRFFVGQNFTSYHLSMPPACLSHSQVTADGNPVLYLVLLRYTPYTRGTNRSRSRPSRSFLKTCRYRNELPRA